MSLQSRHKSVGPFLLSTGLLPHLPSIYIYTLPPLLPARNVIYVDGAGKLISSLLLCVAGKRTSLSLLFCEGLYIRGAAREVSYEREKNNAQRARARPCHWLYVLRILHCHFRARKLYLRACRPSKLAPPARLLFPVQLIPAVYARTRKHSYRVEDFFIFAYINRNHIRARTADIHRMQAEVSIDLGRMMRRGLYSEVVDAGGFVSRAYYAIYIYINSCG